MYLVHKSGLVFSFSLISFSFLFSLLFLYLLFSSFFVFNYLDALNSTFFFLIFLLFCGFLSLLYFRAFFSLSFSFFFSSVSPFFFLFLHRLLPLIVQGLTICFEIVPCGHELAFGTNQLYNNEGIMRL